MYILHTRFYTVPQNKQNNPMPHLYTDLADMKTVPKFGNLVPNFTNIANQYPSKLSRQKLGYNLKIYFRKTLPGFPNGANLQYYYAA